MIGVLACMCHRESSADLAEHGKRPGAKETGPARLEHGVVTGHPSWSVPHAVPLTQKLARHNKCRFQ